MRSVNAPVDNLSAVSITTWRKGQLSEGTLRPSGKSRAVPAAISAACPAADASMTTLHPHGSNCSHAKEPFPTKPCRICGRPVCVRCVLLHRLAFEEGTCM